MAIKTFTTGEVLTAADTNTYLGNSGLVYVKSQTIGTAVASVDVTNAFSADYDNYLVTVTAVDSSSSAPQARLTFGGVAGVAYYGSLYYDRFSGIATGTDRVNAGAYIVSAIYGDSDDSTQTMTIYNPFATKRTGVTSQYYGGGYSGWASGMLYTTASYTYFTLTMSTGTMTGGIVTVYGYRKA